MFDYALDELCAWIEGNGWSEVALQFPEGVKSQAQGIIDALSGRTDASFIILGDPCYGACDLNQGFEQYADALVQFGHSPIPSMKVGGNVRFVEMRADIGLGDLLTDALPRLSDKVGLLATLQYLDLLPQAASFLESQGRDVVIGSGDGRIAYPGQVLGCNHTSAASVASLVDCFLYIGEGNFHALAAALGSGRPVIVLDPVRGELRDMEEYRDRLLRQRFGAITQASDAQAFIVIISGKVGQRRSEKAKEAVSLIRSKGHRAYTLVLEEISPASLIHYTADAFVNTACPRVSIDDAGLYKKPMLTLPELQIALGERDWDDYVFDVIEG